MALLTGFNQIQANTQTFSDWLNKTNEMILMFRGDVTGAQTAVMTANSLPEGSTTFGNATLFGQFAANAAVIFNEGGAPSANAYANGAFGGLRGGNYNFSTNTITTDTLYVTSNTTFTDEGVEVYVNSTYGLIVEQNIEARDDVLFVGDGPAGTNTNPQMHWQAANNNLNFNDDVRATFGLATGTEIFGGNGQAELFYSSGRMYANTDNLDIRANTDVNFITDNFELKSDVGSELYISADVADNSTVKLYYEGNERLSTNTYGIVVTGDAIITDDLVMFDSNKLLMGGTYPYNGNTDLATYNFQIWTDGTDGYIRSGDQDLYLQAERAFKLQNELGTRNYLTANTAGLQEVALYANNIKRLETTDGTLDVDSDSGVEIYGLANTTTFRSQGDAHFDGFDGLNSNNIFWDASANTLYLKDNTPMYFGSNNDLLIVHDGANSLINENGTGSLIIEGTNMVLRATDDSRYLEGIDGSHVLIYSPDDTVALTANNNQVHITDLANTNTLRVRSTSLFENNISIEGSNDTEALSWDKTANTLNFNDNNFATFGTSGDLSISHSGTASLISNDLGELTIRNNAEDFDVVIQSDDGANGVTDYFRADGSTGEAYLYYYGGSKLTTKSIGVEITGNANTGTLTVQGDAAFQSDLLTPDEVALQWEAATRILNFNDGAKSTFGADNDLSIYHETAGDSYITEAGTGDLYVQANNMYLQTTAGGNYVDMIRNAGVTLYYRGATGPGSKLSTISTGIDVTGNVVSDGLTVDGNTTLNGNIDAGQSASSTFTFVARVDSTITPSANNTHDLGTELLRWKDVYVGNTVTTLDLTVERDIEASNNINASTFSGDGAALTNLTAENIATGTINDDRLPAEISSNISGTAAQANTTEIAISSADVEFPIAFVDTSGAYRQNYADATFTFNPSSDTLNVDNLIVDTSVVLPSNLNLTGTTVFEDLQVSNTATILTLEVASLEANGVAFTGTGDDVITSADTSIDVFETGTTRGFKYLIHGENLNDADSGYMLEITVAATANGGIFFTRYGEVGNNMDDVVLTPVVNTVPATDTIELVASCPSASAGAVHRFKVLKIETRG